jgi:hypothetical protein
VIAIDLYPSRERAFPAVQPGKEGDCLSDLLSRLLGLLVRDRAAVGEAAQPPLDVPGREPLNDLAVLAPVDPGHGLASQRSNSIKCRSAGGRTPCSIGAMPL